MDIESEIANHMLGITSLFFENDKGEVVRVITDLKFDKEKKKVFDLNLYYFSYLTKEVTEDFLGITRQATHVINDFCFGEDDTVKFTGEINPSCNTDIIVTDVSVNLPEGWSFIGIEATTLTVSRIPVVVSEAV